MPGLGRGARSTALQIMVPNTTYVSLCVGDPSDNASTFVEANTLGQGGYNRLQTTWTTNFVLVPTARFTTADLTWISTAAWAPAATNLITHIALWNSPTSTTEANFIGYAPFSPVRRVDAAGITITIPSGSLQMTMGPTAY